MLYVFTCKKIDLQCLNLALSATYIKKIETELTTNSL